MFNGKEMTNTAKPESKAFQPIKLMRNQIDIVNLAAVIGNKK